MNGYTFRGGGWGTLPDSFQLAWTKSRKSYCTTPALALASVALSALAKSLTLKFFMWWARRCQASYPVPVTGLVSPPVQHLHRRQGGSNMLKFNIKVFFIWWQGAVMWAVLYRSCDLLSLKVSTFKEKNLLLQEQILFLNSRLMFGKALSSRAWLFKTNDVVS